MKKHLTTVILTLLFTLLSCKSSNVVNFVENENFMIKNGDRVVFWGDSITDNAFYTQTIENYVRSRYPHYKFNFLNRGWGGDTTFRSLPRLRRDIEEFAPTLVFIKLGMNDGAYGPYDKEKADRYIKEMEEMTEIIKKETGARVVFITTIPYEEIGREDSWGKKLENGVYVKTLRKYSDRLIELGAKLDVPVIDLNKSYHKAILEYKKDDPNLKFSADGIHPGPSGHALMAFLILEGMGADGNIMNLSIDLNEDKVLAKDNMIINSIKFYDEKVDIKRKALAFPFEVCGSTKTIVDLDKWHQKLNKNILKVKGMKKKYGLISINDNPVGIYTKEELEKGVNLYDSHLPENEVGSFIAKLVTNKHSAQYTRWRTYLADQGNRMKEEFYDETYESLFLKKKANLLASYLNSGNIESTPYTLSIRELDESTLYPDAPFTIMKPYPNSEEVQVLIRVDTRPWKNILSEKSDKVLSFTPPLKLKGPFTKWRLTEMYDNGKNGDEKASDGVWTYLANVKKEDKVKIFAFDDGSKERGTYETLVTEAVKIGLGKTPGVGSNKHPYFIPTNHTLVEISEEDFNKAVKLGHIKVKK